MLLQTVSAHTLSVKIQSKTLAADQPWSHTEELSGFNSTPILDKPLSALSAGNHHMKTAIMAILLTFGDEMKTSMFLNKRFLNIMVIGEIRIPFKYCSVSTKIVVILISEVYFSSVAVFLIQTWVILSHLCEFFS